LELIFIQMNSYEHLRFVSGILVCYDSLWEIQRWSHLNLKTYYAPPRIFSSWLMAVSGNMLLRLALNS